MISVKCPSALTIIDRYWSMSNARPSFRPFGHTTPFAISFMVSIIGGGSIPVSPGSTSSVRQVTSIGTCASVGHRSIDTPVSVHHICVAEDGRPLLSIDARQSTRTQSTYATRKGKPCSDTPYFDSCFILIASSAQSSMCRSRAYLRSHAPTRRTSASPRARIRDRTVCCVGRYTHRGA